MLTACAPAGPSFAGGRTVPSGRTDLALGGAVRIPFGDLESRTPGIDGDRLIGFQAPGGVVPAGFVRHGLTRNIDLGVEVAGSQLALQFRGQEYLGSLIRLVYGVVPHIGLVFDDEDGLAVRGGATIPLVLAVDVFSLFEVWAGARVALEYGAGVLAGQDTQMTALRTGGVVGLAMGFRRFHVLLELGIDHEALWGQIADTSIERNGLVLTPAFAVRLRL